MFYHLVSVPNTTVSMAGSNIASKRSIHHYTMEDMTNALEDIRNNVLKKSEASRKYGIPLTTLLDKINGRSAIRTPTGVHTASGEKKHYPRHRPSRPGRNVRPRRFYTREAMLGALDAVRSGRMNKKEASEHFDVPYSTMADKLYGRTPT